jgi:hypothetical protein
MTKRSNARRNRNSLAVRGGGIGPDVMRARIRVPLTQATTENGTSLSLWRLTPRFFTLTMEFSKFYQFYRINRATVKYESISPITSAGAVVFGYFQSPKDASTWFGAGSVSEKQDRLLALAHRIHGHRSRNGQFTLNASELMGATPWKDVGVGGTEVSDALLEDCGCIGAMHTGEANAVFGTLFIEMDVEFKGFVNPIVNAP